MEGSINGVTCIKGEIHSITTQMRLNTRWSQAAKYNRDSFYNDEDGLALAFRRLNEYLEGIFDIREVDCVMYIMPFHNIIVSEKASGPLTSSALTSLSKFALYGFLSEQCPRVQEGISLIANCISHCVFEETDWESDELILMKLLELATLCYRSNASKLLTIGSAWEMYNTCISIHNHYRASKILKSEAENALVHLTLSAFGRVVIGSAAIPTELGAPLQLTENGNHLNSIDQALESLKGRSWESLRDSYNMTSELGVTLLLGKIMSVLSEMADLQKHSVETVKFALVLINIALEAGGPTLGSVKPLVDILSNDVCRHLLRASQCEDLAIISQALRVVFNLFMSIKNHMKVQLEVFLISVHMRLIGTQSNGLSTPVSNGMASNTALSQSLATAAAKEELALESLVEFCREPSLMNDIYVNYDCDMQCTNLFDSIITTLCRRALPKSLLTETSLAGDKPVKAGATGTPGKPVSNSRNSVEAASPTQQLFGYGSSGVLFGIDAAPLPAPSKLPIETQMRLSIVNRLALDGVLAVLRSIAGQVEAGFAGGLHGNFESIAENNAEECSTIDLIGQANNHTIDVDSNVDGKYIHEEKEMENSQQQAGGDELDLQVDKWCESGSTSPTCEVLSSHEDTDPVPQSSQPYQTDYSTQNIPNSLHLHRQITNGSVYSEAYSSSAGSPTSSRTNGGRSGSLSCNPIDGENEVTVAVLLERARRAEMLRERKLMKQKYKLAVEKFNKKPLKPDWIRFALDLGILEPTSTSKTNQFRNSEEVAEEGEVEVGGVVREKSSEPAVPPALVEPTTGIDAAALARFFRRTPGLGKTQIGEYISKGPAEIHPFHALVLKEYVKTFDFTGENSSFDGALRMFLGEFRLPGESQCIDRLMEAFAGHLFQHLGPNKPFASADAAFILAFSTIMLNTDLHNPQIPQSKKMTKAEFLRNNRGINDGADLPAEYLENLYNEIKTRQIQVDMDMSDSAAAPAMLDLTDSAMWNKILHKASADQEPAVFTSTLRARRAGVSGELRPLQPTPRYPSSAVRMDSTGSSIRATTAAAVDMVGARDSTHSPACNEPASYERDLFLVMSKPVLETLMALWMSATEDHLICRLMQGLWDFITICMDFGLDQLLSSIVQLLCNKSRALLENERQVPLRPYTRRNVLAHRINYQQLQADTGLDLTALLSEDFEALLVQKISLVSAHTDSSKVVPSTIQSQRSATSVSPVTWTYSSLIKGELLVRLAFETTHRASLSLREESWAAILQLLTYTRSRGALPPTLALIGEELVLHRNEKSKQRLDITVEGNGQEREETGLTEYAHSSLPPSSYAQKCYLEAYGLTLSYPAGSQSSSSSSYQGSHGSTVHPTVSNAHQQATSSSGGSSWFSNIGEFLFAAPSSEAHHDNAMHSGMLDLPNLYCNANASACVDVTGKPLRPDDELLRVTMQHSKSDMLVLATERDVHFSSTAVQVKAMLRMLTAMIETLTSTPRVSQLPQQKGSTQFKTALTASVNTINQSRDEDDCHLKSAVLSLTLPPEAVNAELEDCFPLYLLTPAHSAVDTVCELDVVVVLEWTSDIVLRSETNIQYLWPDLYGFLKLVLEENVDLVAARCPYFLERCIGAVMRAVLAVIDSSSPSLRASNGVKASPLTTSLLHGAAVRASTRHATTDMVWKALRMMRGVPSDVIANLSDRLGAAVQELIRRSHESGQELNVDRWFLLFSLLSAATSGSAGRPYVWRTLCYLVDQNLISDANFTACRHLVQRFVHGVFPGDCNEEQHNKKSAAASAHKPPHRPSSSADHGHGGRDSSTDDQPAYAVESIGFLMRLCLMALGGYQLQTAVADATKSSEVLSKEYTFSSPTRAVRNLQNGDKDGVSMANGTSGSSRLHSPSSGTQQGVTGTKPGGTATATFLLPSVLRSDRPGASSRGKESEKGATSAAANTLLSPITAPQQKLNSAKKIVTEDSTIQVSCITFARTEEAEGIWTETCKVFAELVGSNNPDASFRASYSLEAVLSAGMKCGIPDPLLLKLLGELVQRLPFNSNASSQRPGAPPIPPAVLTVQTVAACQRSCNIVFDLIVQKIKTMRDFDEFHSIWTRFLGVLALNAQTGAARSQMWWHDEMCDTIEALLRLLRLPEAVGTHQSTNHATVKGALREGSEDLRTNTAAQSVPAYSGGLFGWIVAPLIAATEAPAPTARSSAAPSNRSENGSIEGAAGTGTVTSIESSDGYLLRLSWEHICRAYPAFPANLHYRDPKFHSRIATALKLPDEYFRKNQPCSHIPPSIKKCAVTPESKKILSVTHEPSLKPEVIQTVDVESSSRTPTDGGNSAAPAVSLTVTSPPATVGVHIEPPTGSRAELASAPSPAIEEEDAVVVVDARAESDALSPVAAAVATPARRSEEKVFLPGSTASTGDDSASLFSISLSETPTRQTELYDTPLADPQGSVVLPTPSETPNYISDPGTATSWGGSTGGKTTSPYVKNLTPIFASADSNGARRSGSVGITDGSPVRKMDELLSPTVSITTAPATAVTEGSRCDSPPAPWRVYPQHTPATTPGAQRTAESTPAQPQQPPQQTQPNGHQQIRQASQHPTLNGAPLAQHIPPKPDNRNHKIVFKANSKIQVV